MPLMWVSRNSLSVAPLWNKGTVTTARECSRLKIQVLSIAAQLRGSLPLPPHTGAILLRWLRFRARKVFLRTRSTAGVAARPTQANADLPVEVPASYDSSYYAITPGLSANLTLPGKVRVGRHPGTTARNTRTRFKRGGDAPFPAAGWISKPRIHEPML